MTHAPCAADLATAVVSDLNGDGTADHRRGPGCESFDFDLDGRVDLWVWVDAADQRSRTEADYDRDGRIDEIALYRGGQLQSVQRATRLPGRADTWQSYRGGVLAGIERDSNGDGVVDQWWEYVPNRQRRCAVVHVDVDGDGRPDPAASIDGCREGASTAEVDALPPDPSEESAPAPPPAAPAAGGGAP